MTRENKMKLIEILLDEATEKSQDGLTYKLDNSYKLGYLISYMADLIDENQISKIFTDLSYVMNR